MKYFLFTIFCFFTALCASGQSAFLSGKILANGEPLELATVQLLKTPYGDFTDADGSFSLTIPAGKYILSVSMLGYTPAEIPVVLKNGQTLTLEPLELTLMTTTMDEIVVTGTLKEVSRSDSPVPVEVYNPLFFRKNPTPNVFEALQNVNGVRPQLNCNVCNTGDIHINGLEGPYTMVLIDGMPIVSSLSTVYGLSGIPNALIERMEVVKGPASSLYGSEAIGGLINIITKSPESAPLLSADIMATSWQEYNADLGLKWNAGKKASSLTGINYFHFGNRVDENSDNITDVTLQKRISIFQKWNFARKNNRLFTMAGRYFYEDRWGGDMQWEKKFRGGNEIYGESIYTRRWEFIGNYQLPLQEKILFSFSYNDHDQNSVYGDVPYLARQQIGFGQLTWDKTRGSHDLLLGMALRYLFYDDNTPATGGEEGPGNRPDRTWIPGIFLQDEIRLHPAHKLLLGMRYDHNQAHGHIFTPRIAHKWSLGDNDILRLNAGTGFRVVNLFTEDHAALTGARDVVIEETLRPERSWNMNLNYLKKMYFGTCGFIGFDLSAWYTYFTNAIFPDYDSHPDQIIYRNLDGHAVSKGISLNSDLTFPGGLAIRAGATLMDVSTVENGNRTRQPLTERFTGTWSVSYTFHKLHLGIDYTGNLYGPMPLPLLGELDPRAPYSPFWSIQNIQFTYTGLKNTEIYAGIKNLLNWTPNEGNPFLIARSHDPFDREVVFDPNGNAVPTPDNPYALTFDPTYVYAPNQGIRFFVGVRGTIDSR